MNSFLSSQCKKCSEYANQISILKNNYNEKIYGLNTDNRILKVQIEKLLKGGNDALQINKDDTLLKQKIELLIKSNESLSRENKALQIAKNKSANVCASCNQSIKALHNQVTQSEFFKNNSDDNIDREFNCNMESVYKNYLKLESTLQRERKWYQEVNENYQKVVHSLEELKTENNQLKIKLEESEKKIKDKETEFIVDNKMKDIKNKTGTEKIDKTKSMTKSFEFVDKIKKTKFFKNNKKTILEIEKLLNLIPKIPSEKFSKIDMNDILDTEKVSNNIKIKNMPLPKRLINEENRVKNNSQIDENDFCDLQILDELDIDDSEDETTKVSTSSLRNKPKTILSKKKTPSDGNCFADQLFSLNDFDLFKDVETVIPEKETNEMVCKTTESFFENQTQLCSIDINDSMSAQSSNNDKLNLTKCDGETGKGNKVNISQSEKSNVMNLTECLGMELPKRSQSKSSRYKKKRINMKRTATIDRSKDCKKNKLDKTAISKEFVDSSDSDSFKNEIERERPLNVVSKSAGKNLEINDSTFNFDSCLSLPITNENDDEEVGPVEKNNNTVKEIDENCDQNKDLKLKNSSTEKAKEINNVRINEVKSPNKSQPLIVDTSSTKQTDLLMNLSEEQFEFNFSDELMPSLKLFNSIDFINEKVSDENHLSSPCFKIDSTVTQDNKSSGSADTFSNKNDNISIPETPSFESENVNNASICPIIDIDEETIKEVEDSILHQDPETIFSESPSYSFDFLENIEEVSDKPNQPMEFADHVDTIANDDGGNINTMIESEDFNNDGLNKSISESPSQKGCVDFLTDETTRVVCSEPRAVSPVIETEYQVSLTVPYYEEEMSNFNFENDHLSISQSVVLGGIHCFQDEKNSSQIELLCSDKIFSHLPKPKKEGGKSKKRKRRSKLKSVTMTTEQSQKNEKFPMLKPLNLTNERIITKYNMNCVQRTLSQMLFEIVILNQPVSHPLPSDFYLVKNSEYVFHSFCKLLFQSIHDKVVTRNEVVCLNQTTFIIVQTMNQFCEQRERALSILHNCLGEHILNLTLSGINLNFATALLTVVFHFHQSLMRSDLSISVIVDLLIHSSIPVFAVVSAIDSNFIDYFNVNNTENVQINVLITFLKHLLVYEISKCYHVDKIPTLSVAGQQFWLSGDTISENPKLALVSFLKEELAKNSDSLYLINHLYISFVNRS